MVLLLGKTDVCRVPRKDPPLVSTFPKAESVEPLPVVAPWDELKIEIENLLQDHPGQNLAGAKPADYDFLSGDQSWATRIALTSTRGEVAVDVRSIGTSLMVFILQDADGSCMLVDPVKIDVGPRDSAIGYYAWLGGDLGFSSKVVAISHELTPQGLGAQYLGGRPDLPSVTERKSISHS